MRKIKDIRTGTQLLIGFGVIIILMLIVSINAWQQTNKMAQEAEAMYNHPFTVQRSLSAFHKNILNMRISFRNALLSTSEDGWNESIANYEIAKDAAMQEFGLLNERYLGAKSDIDSLRIYFLRWNRIAAQGLEIIANEEMEDALLQRVEKGDIALARNRLLFKINQIEKFASNKANQFYNESMRFNKQLNIQFLFFSLTVLFIALFIATYLSHLINSPLKEIGYAMELYRSGNKSVRSPYSSKNQFGKLSETFNEMAETQETEFLIASRAADITGLMLSEDEARKFSNDLLKNLLEYTQSQMGAIYLLNDEKTMFEHFECIGMDTKGCKSFSVGNKEGEFGMAMASKKINHIKNIPEDSIFSFNTVSGSFKPREIITIPIFNGDQAVAIISLFSIHCYSEISIRLIENIFIALTARMNGILAHKQVVEFSKKLEEQNTELDSQQKELTMMTDELREQNTELEVQKHQLGEVSRLKTNFLSSMSHELRTPLNSVIALAGVLNRRLAKKIEEEEYGYLGVIERNGKHLLNLINDILDLSRIESGKVEIKRNSFKINTLVSEVVAMIQPQSEEKSVRLSFIAEKDDISIESDYNKCFHIFQNIIGNAVKFTERGNVDITVSSDKKYAIVKVSDTGIGISKTDLPYIFDEFRQADGSNARRFEGTGLGLSIAKKYAELIGCEIRVESEQGKGSVFTLSLPVKANYTDQDIESISGKIIHNFSQRTITPKGNGKTILLVEDTEAMITQISDILEVENYKVLSAKNGFEALDQLKINIPNGIILDLMMPGMDGFELLNKIRSEKQTAKLPVLILTAKMLSKEELNEIMNNHVHQLIQKGRITQDSLLEAIALMMLNKTETGRKKQVEIVPVKVTGKPLVLAIEDNADNRLALKAIIGEQYEYIEACNGAEGLDEALKHIPHLIVMDIAMPGMNGFEALKEIRNNPALKHIPVIVVTSSAMRGDKDYFLDFGFNGYVSKPVNSELLFEELNKWIIVEKK